MHSPDTSDERSARTDPLQYSDGDDTPSAYSRPFLSPRQTDMSSPSSRLLDDPSSSVLDFDEDVRSSMALSDVYQVDKSNQDDGSDNDSLTRMSYLGPKMRFHSRAPWELEEDALEDVDETASTAHSGHSGLMGILTGGRGKSHKAGSSSSPRPSTATGRPSAESSRSFLNSKRSFDTSMSSTTHPRGALYALAQESLSTSSLGRPHHPGRQEGLRGKLPLGRLRSNSSTLDIPTSPNDSPARLPLPTTASPSPRASCDTTNSSTLDVQTGLKALFVDRHIDKGFHPYASPELVYYSSELPLPLKSSTCSNPQYPEVPRKDSSSTVIEVSEFPGPAKLLTTSTPTPEMSRRRVSHIQGKEISGPFNVLVPDSPIHPQLDEPVPLPHAIPGWTERNINPGFSLISLEEARAQRRGTALPSPNTKTHGASSSGDSSMTTAVEISLPLVSDASHSEFVAARARTRSISAGAKAKNVLSSLVRQPERRGSENGFATGFEASNAKDVNAAVIASKHLKHKKSGFMRLFGNAKVNEKEPPPVPPPSSVHSLPQSEASAFTPRHNPKLSSHRIPVPSLSPSLLEAVRLEGSYQPGDVIDVSRSSASPKRSLPHILSISTGSSPLQISPRGRFTGSAKDESLPQSAPPDVGDFPTLKLRPISTLFSTHFGDHIDVTRLNFDEEESIGPKETKDGALVRRRENERPRLDSLASTSISSGPSSASATSSQYNLSPIAPSFTGTTLTTPTTGGIMSPTSSSTAGPPWSREHDHVLGSERFSVDQQSVPLPLSPNASSSSHVLRARDAEAITTIRVLQEHLDNTNKMWQKRVWELENEVRSLKTELAGLKPQKHNEGCEKCGRGGNGGGIPPVPPLPFKLQQQQILKSEGGAGGIMNRPRAKTGSSARFVNGQI